ncbi:hypothetical protein RJ55_02661 [Drechmeria coniospora]|nr:hypothetical protein RJ55_02661 [Drechmeria coniospora]
MRPGMAPSWPRRTGNWLFETVPSANPTVGSCGETGRGLWRLRAANLTTRKPISKDDCSMNSGAQKAVNPLYPRSSEVFRGVDMACPRRRAKRTRTEQTAVDAARHQPWSGCHCHQIKAVLSKRLKGTI